MWWLNQHLINFIFIQKIGSSGSVSVVEKAETEYMICKDNNKFNHFNIFHNKNDDEPPLPISLCSTCDDIINHTIQVQMLTTTTNKILVYYLMMYNNHSDFN